MEPTSSSARWQRFSIHGELIARKAIAALPDGEWTAEAALDNDGISDSPVPIKVKISIKGDEIFMDTTGSAPPAERAHQLPVCPHRLGCPTGAQDGHCAGVFGERGVLQALEAPLSAGLGVESGAARADIPLRLAIAPDGCRDLQGVHYRSHLSCPSPRTAVIWVE